MKIRFGKLWCMTNTMERKSSKVSNKSMSFYDQVEIKRSWITSMSTVSIIVPSATPSLPNDSTTTTTITIIFMSRRRMPPGFTDLNWNNCSPQRNQLPCRSGHPGGRTHHWRTRDDFIDNYLEREDLNEVRLAKEFIKFNERCLLDFSATCGPTTMSWK